LCVPRPRRAPADPAQQHALRAHPGAAFRAVPYDGVALACTRDQEAVRAPPPRPR
jgi:hypothetical protein